MISKKDIAKIAKRVVRRQKGLRDHQMIHPRREWVVGLLSGLFLLVGGATWSFVTYGEVSERDVENVNTIEVEQTVYRGEMVEAALEEFRTKKAEYQALLNNTNIVSPEVPTPLVPEAEVSVPETTEAEPVVENGEENEQTEPVLESDTESEEPTEEETPQPIEAPVAPPDAELDI